MKTNTPRTDAAQFIQHDMTAVVDADFARTLEAELAACKESLHLADGTANLALAHRDAAEAELAGIRALADRRNKSDHSQDTTHQLVAALDQALDIAQAELAQFRELDAERAWMRQIAVDKRIRTPTPRTDEEAGSLIDAEEVVPAGFARKLERELYAVEATLASERGDHLRELTAEREKVRVLRSACESICEEWGRNHDAPFCAGQRMETLASKALEKLENET